MGLSVYKYYRCCFVLFCMKQNRVKLASLFWCCLQSVLPLKELFLCHSTLETQVHD